jgi:hypothetical protein
MSNSITLGSEQVDVELCGKDWLGYDEGDRTTFHLKLTWTARPRCERYVDLVLFGDDNRRAQTHYGGKEYELVWRNALRRAFDSGELRVDQMQETQVLTLRIDWTDFDGPERRAM